MQLSFENNNLLQKQASIDSKITVACHASVTINSFWSKKGERAIESVTGTGIAINGGAFVASNRISREAANALEKLQMILSL